MRIGVIIIGDELLSGKRVDEHFAHVIGVLAGHGLSLSWCQYLGDDPDLISNSLRSSIAYAHPVFCFGGIGATPDDHTRAAAARALGVPLERHPEAVAEIEARFGADAWPNRILMADLPRGSTIIPNPFNRIPGFSIAQHHFLPGFPRMAWPMLEWVLERYYAQYFTATPAIERALLVFGAHESELLDLMRAFVKEFPQVRFSSLPTLNAREPRIELGLRGGQPQVATAIAWWEQQLGKAGHRYTRLPRSDA
ncbi:MAG: competence/damage-inducible protein A [Pseudomonadota bacterium]|nr:MAG: competence/damage-inducible protein A [Pseudomonadota bacterium]